MSSTKSDREYLKLAIDVAEEAFEKGNYPVGAVLVIDNEIIGVAGNEINKRKSFVNHAENNLIMEFGYDLAEVREKDNKKVVLYSTWSLVYSVWVRQLPIILIRFVILKKILTAELVI